MKAVILVGGEGTRLQPLTGKTVKTMVPVLNKPFLEYVINQLKDHQINEIILTLCHKPYQIEDYFGDGSKLGVRLIYAVEDFPLGTAGAVKNVQQYIDDFFFVLNGDVFTDLDFTTILHFHKQKQAKVTIALAPVDDPTLYGVVETGIEGKITRFIEKPPPEKVTTNMINAGIYILEPDVLDHIPQDSYFMFEYHLFPKLLDEGKPVFGFPTQGYWIDMGTPEKYRQLNYDLLLGKSNQVKGYAAGTEVHIDRESFMHPTTRIEGPGLIGKGCALGKEVYLKGPFVLGNGCKIGDGSIITGTILWENVEMGRQVTIANSIIGSGSCLRDNTRVENNSVLGDDVFIAKEVTIPAYSRIPPGARIDKT